MRRALLLVSDLSNPVPSEFQDEYRAFLAELEHDDSLGSVGKAKSFVVRLRTDSAVSKRFPHATSVVQKMGPVPGFDTGIGLKVELHGHIVDARVVAVHNPTRRSRPGPSSPVADSWLLESLDNDFLHVVFQRYHEDVAAQLSDIANHANLTRTLQWAKECESIIGQSYQTKLRVIAPNAQSRRLRKGLDEWQQWKLPARHLSPFQLRRKEFFEKNRDQIFAATYIRNTFLYLINQLYVHVGMSTRRQEYSENFIQIERRYKSYFGNDFVEQVHSSVLEIAALQQYLAAYENRDEDGLYVRAPQALSTPWVDRTVEFLRLLHWLREYPLPPHQPRLFISYHFDVSESTTLKGQVEACIKQKLHERLLPLSVSGREDSPRFRECIKYLIWQADGVCPLALTTPKRVGSQEVKPPSWLCSEAEHALHLGKGVVFFQEQDMSEEDFLRFITEQPFDFLVPPAGNGERQERIKELANLYRNNTHESYILVSTDPAANKLDGRLVDRLEREQRRLQTLRHEGLILGYLSQFSLATRQLLLAIHYIARNPKRMNKKVLAKALVTRQFRDDDHTETLTQKEVEAAIANTWRQMKGRSLSINGISYRAFTLHSGQTYSLEVNTILDTLNPDRPLPAVKAIEERLLKQSCATSSRY
jgi:hypothetical protein